MENTIIDADAVLRRAAWRLVPLIMAMYIAAFLNRVNVSFAALTMNQDLGLSPEAYGWRHRHLLPGRTCCSRCPPT